MGSVAVCVHRVPFLLGSASRFSKSQVEFWNSERTHMKDTVKWNLCLRPLKVTKDWPGKLRVVISQ